MKTIARITAATVSAVALGVSGASFGVLAPVAQAELAQGQVTLDSGHTDIFNVSADSEDALELTLKEDVTGSHVLRDPEDVTLKVKSEAWNTAVEDVVGAPGYYLPQTQDQNLLWPGWDTNGVKPHFNEVNINFLDVCGPGKVSLLSTGSFGGVSNLLNNGPEITKGSAIEQNYPGHVHANWIFERSGTYQFTVNASAGGVESPTKTYTFVVEGSDEDPNKDQAAEGANPCSGSANTDDDNGTTSTQPTTPANNTNTGGTGASNNTKASAAATTKASTPSTTKASTGTNSGNKSTSGAGAAAGASGDKNSGGAAQCTPGLKALIKDDRNQPAQWVAPSSINFHLGEKAKKNLPQALGPIPAGEAYMIGSTQEPGVPWLGTNTMHPDLLANTNGDVTFALTSFEGPGSLYVFESGNLGQTVGKEWFKASPGAPSGSHVIPRNSHVHPNWVFSKPGTYKVGITQTATLKDGTKATAPAVVTFTVGGSGSGANEGHFDFGSAVTEDCTDGASGQGGSGSTSDSGSGSTGSSSSGSGSLADTGNNGGILAVLLAGLGLAVLGSGLLFWLRSNNLVS